MKKFIVNNIEILFDPDAPMRGNRYRTVTGKRFTGVTTALNAIAKPALVDWAARMAYEDCLNGADPGECLKLKNFAHKKKSDEAKGKGHDIHALLEDWENITDPMLLPVKKFFEDRGIKILAQEYPVFSTKYWYAGTFDAIAEWKGKRYIIDWKTSSGVYDRSYFAQCAAYLKGFKETYPDSKQPEGYLIIRLDKKKGVFNEKINMTTKTGDLAPYGNVFLVDSPNQAERDFKYFLFCLGVYREGLVDYFEEVAPLLNQYKPSFINLIKQVWKRKLLQLQA